LLDFRRELADILDTWGYDVVLLHNDKRLKCPVCWSSTTAEPDKSCTACFGTGYAYTVSKHRVRSVPISATSITRPAYQQADDYSLSLFDAEAFYFKHDAKINTNDYVLKVGWLNGRASKVIEVYKVMRYENIRGLSGRVEYTSVVGILRPDELDRFNRLLSSLEVRG